MKYRPPFERKRGRWFITASWRNLSLPRVFVYADGDSVSVGTSLGTDGCDPALMIDVDLSGTRLGRLVAAAYMPIADRRWRKRHPESQPSSTEETTR